MSISLFQHNIDAYNAAIDMLAESGKAAIVHPTGTGKSFIGFKLCEDNSDKTICWLSPSEYIFRTQIENLKKVSDGYSPDNIKFYTYAKLIQMGEDELSEIKPAFIIIDEFHRCGAEMWGAGVQRLLSIYPDIPILGLSATAIRYLDNQRDMADELFDGNVASEMTLGESIVRGILNPPKYVLSVFSYQKDLERYDKKIKCTRNSFVVKDEAEKYLEALRRTLEKADGLDVIFDKYMTDRHGKYIVFCANYEHMVEMIDKVPDWFYKVDEKPHIYSAYSDNAETSKEFAEFKEDNSEHLKLLFCIDMLNEGVHIDDVNGVILFRPTVSPIIYKQQIGRALSASKKNEPVIFDIVNNIENLYSIGTIEQEMQVAINYYHFLGLDSDIVNDNFKIFDELHNARILFDKLNESLTASWDLMYSCAKKYYEENGNLEVWSKYKTPEGYGLGRWLHTQRRIRNGEIYGTLDENRIKKLEQIGMVWDSARDLSWKRYYALAKEYYLANGDLIIPATYITKEGVKLGAWIAQIRRYHNSGVQQNYITETRVALLNEIGMVWEDINDYYWEENFEGAKEFYLANGHLDIRYDYVSSKGLKVGMWILRQRSMYSGKLKNTQLTEERIAKLNSIKMIWVAKMDAAWDRGYEAAKLFYERNGNLDVPSTYVSPEGYRLGGWICDRREKGKHKLPEYRQKLLDDMGMIWVKPNSWEVRYALAKAYYEEHGDLLIPPTYKADGIWISKWINEQRQIYIGNRGKKKLTDNQIKRFENIGMVWESRTNIRVAVAWKTMFNLLKDYYQEHGNISVPTDYRTKEGRNLSSWLVVQRRYRKEGRLNNEQIEKLDSVGMIWEFENPWEVGYEHAKAYLKEFGDLRVSHNYVAPDGYNLGNWIVNQRNNYESTDKYRRLDKEQIKRLEKIGVVWKAQKLFWEDSYNRAKLYFQKHKTLKLPRGYKENGYDIYEWVRVQREKYRLGELTPTQIQLLEQIGMDWLTTYERGWELCYESAERYYQKNGAIIKMPCTYVDENGLQVGMWLWRIKRNKVPLKTSGTNGNQVERLAKLGLFIEVDTPKDKIPTFK